MEVMIAASLMLVVALGVATMQSSQSKGNKLFQSQASNVNLAGALRTQLARRQTCKDSFLVAPTAFPGTNEVQVRLGPNATSTIVRANEDLKDWKLRVTTLQVRNLSPYGTTNNGRNIFIGDLFLKAQSAELDPGKRVEFKEIPVSHLTFELNGTTLEACYAGDTYSDTTQQLESVCQMITSPDGNPGAWIGGRCVVNDNNPQATCTNQGGSWDGTTCLPGNPARMCNAQGNYFYNGSCIVPPATTCAAQNGTWNGSTCVVSPVVTCQNMGMEWTGSGCVPNQAVACSRMGPGYSWNGSTCVPPTPSAAQMCGSLGMTWVNGFCQPPLDYASASAGGAAGTVSVTCPYPRHPTGGTCLSTFSNFPLNDGYYLAGRSYYCSWEASGPALTQTVVAQVRCL